jgi:DNA polymerase-3 subunit epsilon
MEIQTAKVPKENVAECYSSLRELHAHKQKESAEASRVHGYHPDRFAHEPEKLETYHKLTAAINRAKDSGDIKTLREIAEDPHGFILR